MDLTGCTAVITGAGNGIGCGIAHAFAKKGVKLAVVDIDTKNAEDVAKELVSAGHDAVAFGADVSNEEEMLALASRVQSSLGSARILVNNAGVGTTPGPLAEATYRDFEWVFGVNVGGIVNGVQAFMPQFLDSENPCWIVNTGSEHSFGVAHLHSGLYTATKHAVLGLSEVLAKETPEHIGVSVLCPGFVNSSMWRTTERRPDRFGGPESADRSAQEAMVLGMDPENVAESVVRGIENEQFYMLSHSHSVEIARGRWLGIKAAFDEQAPRREGDEQYDMATIIAKLEGEL
jgi:NAD(P)-dependent dehydrogenase (short-subunit alcohol dehydrogenase family)